MGEHDMHTEAMLALDAMIRAFRELARKAEYTLCSGPRVVGDCATALRGTVETWRAFCTTKGPEVYMVGGEGGMPDKRGLARYEQLHKYVQDAITRMVAYQSAFYRPRDFTRELDRLCRTANRVGRVLSEWQAAVRLGREARAS